MHIRLSEPPLYLSFLSWKKNLKTNAQIFPFLLRKESRPSYKFSYPGGGDFPARKKAGKLIALPLPPLFDGHSFPQPLHS